MKATVIGLGKLGGCFAASLANAGITTYGVDKDEAKLEKYKNREAPRDEPKLQEYLNNISDSHLKIGNDIPAAVEKTDISFIFVDTYSKNRDEYKTSSVKQVAKGIQEGIIRSDQYHTVAQRSTVMPGDTKKCVWENILAHEKIDPKTFGVCFYPEFTAVGDVIEGLENPDITLIGADENRPANMIEKLQGDWVGGVYGSEMLRTDIESAEVAKMAINSYVSTKMSYANMLAHICEDVGANVDDVTTAMAKDSRISPGYFTSGARFGGPCFPRDNPAFEAISEDVGLPIAKATNTVNKKHTSWIRRHIPHEMRTVAILGFAYKPGVDIVEESQGIDLLKELVKDHRKVYCVDPNMTSEMVSKILRETEDEVPSFEFVRFFDPTKHPRSVLLKVDCAVLCTRWDEYTDPEIYPDDLLLIDPWREFVDKSGIDPELSCYYNPLGSPHARID